MTATCERALKKRPADRFESAEEMRVAVGRIRAEIDPHVGLDTSAMTIGPRNTPRNTPRTGYGNSATGAARRPTVDVVSSAR